MVSETDWRRMGQETYLKDKTLFFIPFSPCSKDWDHEHCAFCWATFSACEGDEREGYCTERANQRGAHWICRQCYEDFRDEFNWTVE